MKLPLIISKIQYTTDVSILEKYFEIFKEDYKMKLPLIFSKIKYTTDVSILEKYFEIFKEDCSVCEYFGLNKNTPFDILYKIYTIHKNNKEYSMYTIACALASNINSSMILLDEIYESFHDKMTSESILCNNLLKNPNCSYFLKTKINIIKLLS